MVPILFARRPRLHRDAKPNASGQNEATKLTRRKSSNASNQGLIDVNIASMLVNQHRNVFEFIYREWVYNRKHFRFMGENLKVKVRNNHSFQ